MRTGGAAAAAAAAVSTSPKQQVLPVSGTTLCYEVPAAVHASLDKYSVTIF